MSPNWKSRWLVFCHDLLWVPVSVVFSFWLRFNFDPIPTVHFKGMLLLLTCALLMQIMSYVYFKLYRGVWHYVSLMDMTRIVHSVFFGVLATFILVFVLTRLEGVPRSVLLLYPLFLMIGLVVPRIFYRWLKDRRGHLLNVENKTPVLLIGAGRAGDLLLRDMLKGGDYEPVGILDDDTLSHGKEIHGVRVLGSSRDLELFVHKMDVKMVMLAIPTASQSLRNKIVSACSRLHVRLLILPSLQQLESDVVNVSNLREACIEDLLGRDIVVPDHSLLCACITNKVVLVTGAGGSIGSELCRQIILHRPKQLILFELNEFSLYQVERELTQLLLSKGMHDYDIIPILGSVTNQKRFTLICKTFAVNTVYHAAAYKHVPLVEWNVIEAVSNNVFGTLRIAQAAIAACVDTFILVSTDKAVRPTNVMGTTKRLAELILQALNLQSNVTRFCMVRFGNVLGSSGSVIPLFRDQIKAGGPVTVTHADVTRYFMTIPEAAQLVLQASSMGKGGDVFVLDMGEPVRIIDLAHKMIHLSGLSVKNKANPEGDIEIVVSGLRPGEKLYEELLIGDCVEETQHPLVMRANEILIEWEVLDKILNQLSMALDQADVLQVRQILLEVVSEYQPQCDIQDLVWKAQQ